MSISEVLKDQFDGHIIHDVIKLSKNKQNATKTNTVEMRTQIQITLTRILQHRKWTQHNINHQESYTGVDTAENNFDLTQTQQQKTKCTAGPQCKLFKTS